MGLVTICRFVRDIRGMRANGKPGAHGWSAMPALGHAEHEVVEI